MKKVYYDFDKHIEVCDISGERDFNLIKAEFNLSGNVKVLELEDGAGYRFENGKIVEYSIQDEVEQQRLALRVAQEAAKERIKIKLGLSDGDLDSLVIATKE